MFSEDEIENTTYLWVAETVLLRQKRPLRASDIVKIGLDDGLFGDKILSKTPQKSMQARLSMDIIKPNGESKFLRTEPGRFFLRSLLPKDDDKKLEKDNISEYVPPRRCPPPTSEMVLVVGEKDYKQILDFQGIDFSYQYILNALLSSSSLTYLPRAQAEVASGYKQFVTYTIIQSGERILCFRRGRYNRAPSLLRGARCIGFGGHVNEKDHDILSHLDRGIRYNSAREISEEIRLSSGQIVVNPDDIEPIGILNDDSSEIGKRHLAVLLRYVPTVEWERPIRGEASINELKWLRLDRRGVRLLEFEYWSQLCLRKLFPSCASADASYIIRNRSIFTKKNVLCIVGSIGSGKSVTTSLIKEHCHHHVINTGKLLAEILGVPPVPSTERTNFQTLAQDFIDRQNGPEQLATKIADQIEKAKHQPIIVDGIRHMATFEHLSRLSPLPLALVYVQTPPDVAFDLYRNRETNNADISLEDFMKILNAPSESAIRYLIAEADAVIYNWHGLDSYKRILFSFLAETKLARYHNA